MHKSEMRVQWFDVDRADVAYFGNFFRFFTAAEDEFMRSIGMSHRGLKDKFNIGFTRIEAECRYIRPALYEDLIEVHLKPQLENKALLTFEFRIFRQEGEVLLAEGKVQTACVRLGKEFRVIRMPGEIYDRLSGAIKSFHDFI